MQSIRSLATLVTLIFILTGCSGSSSDSEDTKTLKIESVYTDIWHQHPSFFGKWGAQENMGIRFTIAVRVSVPQGRDHLSEVSLQDKVTNRTWSLLGGPQGVPKEECYISSLDIYECILYSSVSLNRVNLKNWEIFAVDKENNIVRKDFEFLLPGGNPIDDTQFVYSESYSGSRLNGVPALNAMTIAKNDIKFSSDSGSQSFHIEFENTDSRAKYYGFYFYDGTSDINSIGEAKVNAPSIESMAMIQGQKTIIDIPWSEIRMYGNSRINDINGLHIALYDEPISWIIDGGRWFNYISLSEFLTLAP